ncbi:MAG: Pycsar system effector family protein [Ferruginibacter sp.]
MAQNSTFHFSTMDATSIIIELEQHVTTLFKTYQSPKLLFHNLQHTENVVSKTKEIARHYELGEHEMLILVIAAWFHDTGYLFSPPAEHEEKSVEIMKLFAREKQVPFDIVNEVSGCIMATKAPRHPAGILQEILCDADTFNLGTTDFKRTNEIVFQEFQNASDVALSRKAFDEGALIMLKQHKFYTGFCKEQLTGVKKENMKKIKKKIKKGDAEGYEIKIENNEITEKDGTTKGMQTMLRLTSSNHIKLSEMADSKANILISVNAIIISVILGVLLRKLQSDPYLTIPTIIFLTFSVVTIVVSILATRPTVNAGTFNNADIINKKTNLLFFGNFHSMEWLEYEDAMRTMMRDSDYLYGSIIQDIYHLGVVLGRKYKLVRWAYNIFMVGIVISVVSFALASLLYTPATAPVGANTSGSPF